MPLPFEFQVVKDIYKLYFSFVVFIEEIKNQLAQMQQGNITDFEIESAKLAIINSFKSNMDTVSGTEGWYIGQMLDKEILTVEQAVDAVIAVSKDDNNFEPTILYVDPGAINVI